ncbi:MAG TPA: ABC transporter ATP-binding protein [Terriglobales bacterium]|nr:ABC transporter ATP-binding protein [Terriglobales bacterium]
MPCALIDISELTVRYRPMVGGPVLALNNVNLKMSPGEIVGLLGESGSGKSTLAATILQLLPATAERQGRILFKGENLTPRTERELRQLRGRHISVIPQDPANALNPVMRAGAQISEVLRAHMRLTRAERQARVLELLHEVGFDDPERIRCSYPHQLSGGQRQRVVIAQAIACRPELIIADEPTSKLDPVSQTQVLELIAKMAREHKTALLWITHDPATLAGFADRVAVMHSGRIVEEACSEKVFTEPAHAYTRALMRISQELTIQPRELAGHVQ